MKLSLTTPRGALVDLDVEEVTAPGSLGEFGVLPGHVPLMSALKPGVLVYHHGKGRSGVVAVGAGFLQVAAPAQSDTMHDRVLVLVDQALVAADIDKAEAEKDLAAADKELAAWASELDGAYKALEIRRQWAQARLDASARIAPH
jgi:F-type H+-transporting ATPase subunit epsilon